MAGGEGPMRSAGLTCCAYPLNSWPRVMGTASWRCVRPTLEEDGIKEREGVEEAGTDSLDDVLELLGLGIESVL